MLTEIELTPTAALDKQWQPAARFTDGSIRDRAAVSPAVARLLFQASSGSARRFANECFHDLGALRPDDFYGDDPTV